MARAPASAVSCSERAGLWIAHGQGSTWLPDCWRKLVFFFTWLNYFVLIKIKPKMKLLGVIC